MADSYKIKKGDTLGAIAKKKFGGINELGYKKGSPYANEPYIDIQGNDITMVGVPHDILALPNNDKPIIMKPGKNYKFKNSKIVREIPISPSEPQYQIGGIGGVSIMNGLAGEAKHPDSPFLNLKNFINKYKDKKQMGGVFNYMSNFSPELQDQFVQDFESLDKNSQKELIEYFKGGYYQEGGVHEYPRRGIANAELEDKETVQTPDGTLSKVTGKTHKEGGEDVSLPNGTLVFSDYLKVPEDIAKQVLGKKPSKKMSYADISKKFPTKPYLEILSDPESDEYKTNTAQVKLATNLGKLNTLFFAQEKSKQQKEGKEENNFQLGGEVEDYSNIPDEELLGNYYDKLKYGLRDEMVETELKKRNYSPNSNLPEVEIIGKRNETTPKGFTVQPTSMVGKANQVSQTSNGSDSSVTGTKVLSQNPLVKFYPKFNEVEQPVLGDTELAQPVEPTEQLADVIIESNDDKNYTPTKNQWWKNFGVSNKLAGTVADIGLALGDKLRVSEPILHDRTKTPLFTRFVNFDDKEAQRMFSLNIQQIQNSNLPEQVKRAQISELTSKYSDYQARQDFTNLQRYEAKRERDTEKLQKYKDVNIDQRIADVEEWRQKKARVDELRDMFKAQRKSRIVNALKSFGDYTDKIGYFNEMNPNYGVNPLSGRVTYRSKPTSELTENILSQYQQKNLNNVSLPNGATLTILPSGNGVVTDASGKVEIVKMQ